MLVEQAVHAQQSDADIKRLAELRANAEGGDSKAQNELGLCYDKGQGVAQDEVEGAKWFRIAAEHNDAEAQSHLGYCYAHGYGVTTDEVEAVKWYRKAAEQNNAVAQSSLGYCYAHGYGVTTDEVEAVKWITLAAAQGVDDAKTFIPLIENNMQEKQIAEGKRRANDWLEKWKRASAASSSKP